DDPDIVDGDDDEGGLAGGEALAELDVLVADLPVAGGGDDGVVEIELGLGHAGLGELGLGAALGQLLRRGGGLALGGGGGGDLVARHLHVGVGGGNLLLGGGEAGLGGGHGGSRGL